MIERAVIYIRVSTADQVENFSLATQEAACLEYCKQRGLEADRVFREEGESAKSANRTRLNEMVKYCAANRKARNITTVVVYRVDRFARKMADHTALKAILKQ